MTINLEGDRIKLHFSILTNLKKMCNYTTFDGTNFLDTVLGRARGL